MLRGPEDTPGHWVVSGARLSVQHGKIYVHVKYSLLSFVMQSETEASQGGDEMVPQSKAGKPYGSKNAYRNTYIYLNLKR
ncbi:MACPF domain-containing protein CAD1 [Spatholobus suberectus]|nr:MACPF domain-containing protein CAD1 [Spatholobus suberectus]